MPSSTLQARIKAFEAIGSGASKEVLNSVAVLAEPEHLLDRPHSPSAASIPPIVPTTYSPSASPKSLQHRTSLLDLKDWVIDDGPFGASPTTTILTGCSPLSAATPLPHESAPLISFDGSPPKFVRVPPLPPRKLSSNSPRSVSAPAASPTTATSNNMLMPPSTDTLALKDLSPSDGMRRAQGHMHASSVSSFHSVSLSSDGGDDPAATPGALHAFPMEREWTGTGTEDGESLDESFENVSAPSSFLPPPPFPPRPPSLPPGKPALGLATKQPPPPPPLLSQPPRLPQRPITHPRGSANSFASHSSSPSPVTSVGDTPVLTRNNSASSSSHSHQSTRRVPPPPPPSAAIAIPSTNAPRPRSARTSVQSTATTSSDRSSLFSHGTTTSRSSISSRMTSISASASTLTPTTGTKQAPAGRVRYDAVFSANARVHAPKPPPPPTSVPLKRQNAGWRGLSIDVPPPIPASPTPPGSAALTEPGPEARLDGRIVRAIWLKSRLEQQRLRGIWCVIFHISFSSHYYFSR